MLVKCWTALCVNGGLLSPKLTVHGVYIDVFTFLVPRNFHANNILETCYQMSRPIDFIPASPTAHRNLTITNCVSGEPLSIKQVRTNNEAAFQCHFIFNIFSFYECYLFPLNGKIDFQLMSLDFAIDFAILTMWLQTYGWTYGRTDW